MLKFYDFDLFFSLLSMNAVEIKLSDELDSWTSSEKKTKNQQLLFLK